MLTSECESCQTYHLETIKEMFLSDHLCGFDLANVLKEGLHRFITSPWCTQRSPLTGFHYRVTPVGDECNPRLVPAFRHCLSKGLVNRFISN
jgi:hypothetical protein